MNILHIEKSSLISGIIKKIIVESGNSINNTADSSTGISILKNEEIDLILIGLDDENPEGEIFLKKLHKNELSGLPVIVLTEDNDLVLDERLFCFGVVDIINKKFISDGNFKRFFDVYLREDRLLKELRNISMAVLDGSSQCLNCYKALFKFYRITNAEFFLEPEELLSCTQCHDFYILDLTMPRVSGEKVIKSIRERNRDSFVAAVTTAENERLINNIVIAGADDFISKPFTANIFMSRMKADIRHYLKIKSFRNKN